MPLLSTYQYGALDPIGNIDKDGLAGVGVLGQVACAGEKGLFNSVLQIGTKMATSIGSLSSVTASLLVNTLKITFEALARAGEFENIGKQIDIQGPGKPKPQAKKSSIAIPIATGSGLSILEGTGIGITIAEAVGTGGLALMVYASFNWSHKEILEQEVDLAVFEKTLFDKLQQVANDLYYRPPFFRLAQSRYLPRSIGVPLPPVALPVNLPKIKIPEVHYLYELIVIADGDYDNYVWGSKIPMGKVHLKAGDTWKIGTSYDPDNRYLPSFLVRNNVSIQIREVGTKDYIRVMEKAYLLEYMAQHNGHLPAGNKILR
jgi:hypothetical protein